MDWLTVLFYVFVVLCVVLTVVHLRSDCDFLLCWCDHYGKHPASLKDKVVWVTGASSGIGEALALELARAGCKLVLSARREDRLLQTEQQCLEQGQLKREDILVLPLDVLDFDSHKQAVETVLKYFKKIDVLVNNAGRSQRALWETTSLDVDKQMLDVNVLGPISLTKAVLPHFIERKSGHFVVTSSVAGKMGAPGIGSYSGAKHALHGYFDTLRIEVSDRNVGVTMVCPGPVFSEALIHAFTHKPDEKLGVEMKPGEKRMATSRCARLMAVAMANKLEEVWVSGQPELLYLYLFQYLPVVAIKLAKVFGRARTDKIRAGMMDLHS